jgi:phosphohistidine phosphatase
MDLILWRHAEAEDGAPDMARRLTPKGVKHAKQMAEWLQERLPGKTRIISSPAVRARQTVQALTDDYEVLQGIDPEASYRDILKAARWPDAGRAVLVVGHQPTLGQTAAFLLSGSPREWSIKKAGIWWFTARDRDHANRVVLRAVAGPDLL